MSMRQKFFWRYTRRALAQKYSPVIGEISTRLVVCTIFASLSFDFELILQTIEISTALHD